MNDERAIDFLRTSSAVPSDKINQFDYLTSKALLYFVSTYTASKRAISRLKEIAQKNDIM